MEQAKNVFYLSYNRLGTLEKTDKLYTPGPNQYTPKTSLRSYPKWKFPTASRIRVIKGFVPGVGNYNLPYTFPDGPKYSMSSKAGSVDESRARNTPGPGSYYPKYHYKNPKYTMSSKNYLNKSDITPSPADYTIKDEFPGGPSYKFGTENKDGLSKTMTKFSPGPGNYEYKADILNRSQPKFSFGKEKRGEGKRDISPGPGSYNYKEFIGKEAPKITISSKYKKIMVGLRNTPGPASYNQTNYNRSKSPSFSFGSSKRDDLYKPNGVPGAGKYLGHSSSMANIRPKTPAWGFGTSKRPPLNPVDPTVPGVGEYDVNKSTNKGIKYTMVGRGSSTSARNGVPGVGAYNIGTNNNLTHHPAWKIGTSNRDDNLQKIIRENYPGPASYNYTKDEIRGPKYTFGSEKRSHIHKNDNPGPSDYHIPCSIVDVNDYTRQSGKFDPQFRYI